MADDNVENQSAPVTTDSKDAAVTKPEYVQDKFWDADRKEVNLENLASSYNALEKKLGSRTEDLSKQIRTDIEQERLRSTPEEYKVNLPELPENVDVTVSDDMEIVQWWKETAKKKGLSQEEFDTGVNAFVQNAVATLPDVNVEMEKLGSNAKERLEAAELWSKKYLSPESYDAFSKLAATAEGVTAVEELMRLTKDTSMPTTPTQVSVTPDLTALKSMMADPKYWKDGEKDPAYIKRVTDLYEKAFDKQKQ